MLDEFGIESKIREYYLKFLEREADTEGLNHFSHEIKNGRLNIGEIPKILQLSQEYKTLMETKKGLQELKKGYAVTKEGFELFLDTEDHSISRVIAFSGIYEPVETEFLKKIIKPNMHVIDVGANIGYFTTLFSRLVGPQGKVTAFEPSPRSFLILKKNAMFNCIKNVTIIQKAIANFSGKEKFYLSSINTGDNRFSGDPIEDYDMDREEIEVDVIKLDEYFLHENVDFLKIDAQGAEMKILESASNIIENNPNLQMMLEFWPVGLSAQKTSGENLLAKIKQLGFNIYDLNDMPKMNTSSIENLCNRYTGKSYTNIFCTKDKNFK